MLRRAIRSQNWDCEVAGGTSPQSSGVIKADLRCSGSYFSTSHGSHCPGRRDTVIRNHGCPRSSAPCRVPVWVLSPPTVVTEFVTGTRSGYRLTALCTVTPLPAACDATFGPAITSLRVIEFIFVEERVNPLENASTLRLQSPRITREGQAAITWGTQWQPTVACSAAGQEGPLVDSSLRTMRRARALA